MVRIVFDLEATCWLEQNKNFRQEIIEIGAYKLDEYGEVIDKFQQFVRPQVHPYLSSYCTQLTSISQKNVDRAKYFPVVQDLFLAWIDQDEYKLISWGRSDIRLLKDDCEIHKIDTDWLDGKHIDLKDEYKRLKQLKKRIGFQKALELEGMNFVGTQHRAIYDAANLVQLYTKYIDVW